MSRRAGSAMRALSGEPKAEPEVRVEAAPELPQAEPVKKAKRRPAKQTMSKYTVLLTAAARRRWIRRELKVEDDLGRQVPRSELFRAVDDMLEEPEAYRMLLAQLRRNDGTPS